MNRSVLAGITVLLLGGMVGLYFLVIKQSPSAKPSTPVATGGSGTTTPTGLGPALPDPSGAPQLPQGHNSMKTDRDTTGMVLTDHRDRGSGSNVVLEGTEGSGAPKRALDPGLVRSVHRNAQPIMLACAAKVPAADRGPRPRIGVSLKVQIKDHELSVVGVTPELIDLGGDQAKVAEDCVRQMMMNFTAPTPDEADVDSHELRYQYVVK